MIFQKEMQKLGVVGLKLHKFFKKLATQLVKLEPSAARLSASCCLGICLATSPFLGLQTWIAIPLAWAFKLNAKVAVAVLWIVNNPFTMIPFVVVDYATGYWVIERLLGIDLMAYNPSFMYWINDKIGGAIYSYLGVEHLCFWCYILGGLLFCLLVSWPWYWLFKRSFARFLALHKQ